MGWPTSNDISKLEVWLQWRDKFHRNGRCIYCGKNDGKTEIRSVGPIHLVRCWARYTTVQRKKKKH